MNDNFSVPIAQLQKRFKSVLLRLPILAGNEAVNFVLDNFRKGGFLGHSFQPWRKRKNPNKWGQKPKRDGRALLVDTGRLRRSIRITKLNADSVTIGTDVPYAKAHNEGLNIGQIQTVKAHTRKKMGVATISSIKIKKSRNTAVQTGSIQVKEHTRKIVQKIPARKFMGKSPYLDNKLKRIITAELMKALKS
jgi:phage gpG-like protein